MKPIGIVYVIIGIVAIVGALAASYVAITLGQALSSINTANAASVPPGTDLATLQQSARSLGTLIMISWVWIISVLLSGIISVHTGVKTLKSKSK